MLRGGALDCRTDLLGSFLCVLLSRMRALPQICYQKFAFVPRVRVLLRRGVITHACESLFFEAVPQEPRLVRYW